MVNLLTMTSEEWDFMMAGGGHMTDYQRWQRTLREYHALRARLAELEKVARAAVAFTNNPDLPMGHVVDSAVRALRADLRAELAGDGR